MFTRIKICCISSIEEARLAIHYGATALGLVSAMPSGPGVINEETIQAIARFIPPGVASFLLTSKQDVAGIIAQQKRCGVNTLQLVDRLVEGSHADLKNALPGIGLVQVIHVSGLESIEEAVAIAPYVDAILLDSGNQKLAVKELGGTGRTHDWSLSQQIVAAVNIPVYLAGGLRAENAADAIRTVKPFGLDICSGIRTGGRLDETKLAAFFKAIRASADAI